MNRFDPMKTTLKAIPVLFLACTACAADFYVSPAGDDANPGTADKPFATPGRARQAARAFARKEPVTVTFRAGIYYLADTLKFTADDSGASNAPVVYQAAPGEEAVLSGGRRLELKWEPYTNGIVQAPTPGDLQIDQLFVDGRCQRMARYPNYDPDQPVFNGYAADAFSRSRAARWADPRGGFIHAMHKSLWGGFAYVITGKDTNGDVTYAGGWQNNRQAPMHKEFRYVENIFEELDAPGEWFWRSNTLYFYPPAGVDPGQATVEVVRLRHLVEFNGSETKPVRFITLRGFTFHHAARTFMDTKEPLLRSDWTIYRGGAVVVNGAEDCVIADGTFDQLGGNAIFVNGYDRRVTVRGCLIRDCGGNGVAFVGDPKAVRNPLFEYRQHQDYGAIDPAPGPQTDDYPAECTVEDCLITRIGRVEKQAAGVEISMSRKITVRHCSIYEVPRAGINVGDGCWGGDVIEGCDVFDTVLETGDHGSFNAWGRDRYWRLGQAPANELPRLALLDAVEPIVIRNNRWRCDHGWDIDLDDGSSNYEISSNLLLNGGIKLREGFARKVWNNITVNNSLCPHVWFADSGDVVVHNLFMAALKPAAMKSELQKWGKEVDNNFYPSEADRRAFAEKGCDEHSLAGDPQFRDPAHGDFRVADDSAVLKTGFRNFPMDQFGVRKPGLKAIARTPVIPSPGVQAAATAEKRVAWKGASLRRMAGEEYSVVGVARDADGVFVVEAPGDSEAGKSGLRSADFIQTVNGKTVRDGGEFLGAVRSAADKTLKLGIIRNQKAQTLEITP